MAFYAFIVPKMAEAVLHILNIFENFNFTAFYSRVFVRNARLVSNLPELLRSKSWADMALSSWGIDVDFYRFIFLKYILEGFLIIYGFPQINES